MGNIKLPHHGRVVAVVGGGNGIGAAAVTELGTKGAMAIAVDPGVSVTGDPVGERSAQVVIDELTAAGGSGWASTVSSTDRQGLRQLLAEIVERHGRLDAVIYTAGILRYPRYPRATQDDWEAVIDVHLTGYLNVLEEALPVMERAGRGRIVGFVSGAGLARTSPDGPAYGCAKRAVASLTWELRGLVAEGISVNAMSPIAATRMVVESLVAAGAGAGSGLDLSAMPQAQDMAPLASYLASEQVGWCHGQVLYSAGSEISIIAPPRLLEVMRTRDADVAAALGTLVPVVLEKVETDQRTSGGSNPRFGNVFGSAGEAGEPGPVRDDAPGCLIAVGESAIGASVAAATMRWGLAPLGAGAWQPFDRGAAGLPDGFEEVAGLVERAERIRPLEAIVVALPAPPHPTDASSWRGVVSEHRSVPGRIVATAAWLRAASESAQRTGRPVRIVFITDATSPAGRTAAQAVAQLARNAKDTPTPVAVHAFAIADESGSAADIEALAALTARLLRAEETIALAGAELVAQHGWIGHRSHPGPVATVSFGGPAIPEWVDAALQEMLRS